MPGGVHYLLGLFLIYFFSIFNNNNNNQQQQLKKKSNDDDSSAEETSIINAISHSHQYFKVGLVFGSVVPDIDVLVAVAAIIYSYLMGGTTNDFVEIADLVHRSATHTLLLWVPMVIFTVLLSGAITACINNARSCSSNDQQASRRNRSSSNTSVATDCIRSGRSNSNVSHHHHHPRREHDQVSIVKSKRVLQLEKCHCWVQFALGLSIGAIVHVLADTIYLKGVKMMWPWTQKVFFYELPQLHLFHIYYYHPYTQKIFFVIDHCSEIVFYLILIMYTHMDQNTLFKLKCVCYAQFSANFICFLIDRFLDMQFHNFVILLYFPGVPFLAISVSIPLLMAPQIGNFEWSRVFSFSKKTSTSAFSSIGAQKPACKTL